ncbi:MAG: hypothetical protein C0624_09755 [Desulfuromonas sp.]|nr:MAG: hypothetical protein C0624_09755 [Desulfuromonas sp.]
MTSLSCRPHRRLIYILSFLSLLSTPAWSEPLIAEISINGMNRGAFILELTTSGDFLMRPDDFRTLELLGEEPSSVAIQGETFISLSSLCVAPLSLDEASLTLNLPVDPKRLPAKSINLEPQLTKNILYPRDTSLFFNYGVNYYYDGITDRDRIEVPHELGFRYLDTLFLANALFSDYSEEQKYVRLMSGLSYDNRSNLNRLQVGDFFSTAGKLGSRLNLGGVNFSRNYDIAPYFIEYATTGYSGELTTPSKVQVFLDGTEIYTENLPPGPYSLDNILHSSGAGMLEVVITDAFGNERRIEHPFYIEDSLLKKGGHQFNYSAGTLRESFGSESNDYGASVYQAEHRYGLKDILNLGGAIEGSSDLFNARAMFMSLLGPYGVMDIEVGGSSGYDNSGMALSFEYKYLARHFNARALVQYFDEGYRRLTDDETPSDLTETVSAIGLGFVFPGHGSLSFDIYDQQKHIGDDQTLYSVSYNRRITNGISMTSSLRHKEQAESEDVIFLNLNYTPWQDIQISLLTDISQDTNSEILQVQDSPPAGEGYGYRVNMEHTDQDTGKTITFNPSGQWNSHYGIFKAELENVSGYQEGTSYRLSASGALVTVGSHWGATRPIADSFALVSVNQLEGITVKQSSRTSGTTNKDGYLFIPDLKSFYTNQVSIDDRQVPMNYTIPFNQQLIAPPYRSGSCMQFPATHLQPIIGRLKLIAKQHSVPLDYTVQQVQIKDERYPLHIGKGGEFYVDPSDFHAPARLQSGCPQTEQNGAQDQHETLVLIVHYEDQTHQINVETPDSDELFIDVGDIVLTLEE